MGMRGSLAIGSFALVLLASLGLALPHAAAASGPAEGSILTEGVMHLPETAELEVRPLALVVADATGLQTLDLTASDLRVCVGEWQLAEVSTPAGLMRPPPTSHSFACHSVSDAKVGMTQGNHSGWIGFYPAVAAMLHAEQTSLERRNTLEAVTSPDANGATTKPEDKPDWPFYHRAVPEAHFLLSALGGVELRGPGALKLKGPDVLVEARENATTYTTEDRASSDAPVRERVMRWIYLEWEEGTLRLEAPPEAMTVAVAEGAVSWDGRVTFQAVSGVLTDAAGMHYDAARGEGWLEGRFTGSLAPLVDERGRLRFEGELRGSSFEARVPVAPGAEPTHRLLVLAAAVGLVAGGTTVGGLLLWHRGREKAAAERAAEREEEAWWQAFYEHYAQQDYDETMESLESLENALAWVREGLRRFPGNVPLAVLASFFLRDLGRPWSAIEALTTASKKGPKESGEADYWLARLYVSEEAVRDFTEAAIHCERALRRNPSLWEEMDVDPAFKQLRGTVEFEAALTEAERRT